MKAITQFLFFALIIAFFVAMPVSAQTVVPSHSKDRYDVDNNGYPDVGVVSTGKYESLFAYDATGNYYQDFGDGRIGGTVTSIAYLQVATLTICTYQNVYRGEFNNDSFLDTGWISNMITCRGYEQGAFHYLFVHESDPRYTGTRPAVWGSWEYHVLTESGSGNILAGLRNLLGLLE